MVLLNKLVKLQETPVKREETPEKGEEPRYLHAKCLEKAGMHRVYFTDHYGQGRFGSEGAGSAEGL